MTARTARPKREAGTDPLTLISQMLGRSAQLLTILDQKGNVYQLSTPVRPQIQEDCLHGCVLQRAPKGTLAQLPTLVATGAKPLTLRRVPHSDGDSGLLGFDDGCVQLAPHYASLTVKSSAAEGPHGIAARLVKAGVSQFTVETGLYRYQLAVTDATRVEERPAEGQGASVRVLHGLRLANPTPWMIRCLEHERRGDYVVSLRQLRMDGWRFDVESYWRTAAVNAVGFNF